MASRARLEAILEAKSAILEAKSGEDYLARGGTVEWRRPFGYAKSTASTVEHVKVSHARHP